MAKKQVAQPVCKHRVPKTSYCKRCAQEKKRGK